MVLAWSDGNIGNVNDLIILGSDPSRKATEEGVRNENLLIVSHARIPFQNGSNHAAVQKSSLPYSSKSSPDDIRARQELGFLYSRLGKPDEAADHFKWVIDRLLSKDDHAAALEVCRKMTMQDPSDPHGHYQRASILLSQNRLEEALPAVEKAAQLFLQKGNPLKARDTANLGLRHFPSSAALSELLEMALEATRPVKVQDEAAAKQEEEFSEWISSLEDEISAAPIEREPVTTGFVSRDDLRVLYFRDQIALMNDEQLASMEKHLKTMYSDIQELYQKGLVESQEVRTVKQFYRAFCIALEQNKRMR